MQRHAASIPLAGISSPLLGGAGPAGPMAAAPAPVPDGSSASPYAAWASGDGAAAADASDEEVMRLLKELECSVGSPHTAAVMRDAVCAIERRAVASFDPLNRDLFLEQRIRDVLSELSRTSNAESLLLAVDFIDALLPVPYTNPQQKFPRLCRSLFIVLHCGILRPAKEAQRVLKRMLKVDLTFSHFDPPLKSFIKKELKDNCELALIQLHGRVQQSTAPFVAQFLAVMLALAATAEVNSHYMSGQLRPRATQLAIALSGSFDTVLRSSAYDCLRAIFSHTNAMRKNEVVLENRRIVDDAIRSLTTNHHNESSVISTLQMLRALISERGIHCMDKQILPQLCVLVTEQHRVSKSSAVRMAVCNLVPVIAEIDIASAARCTAYCAIIMEPVKNVRDEKNKDVELRTVANFIQNVGYDVLDSTNRTNLDSILLRYIARRETQEECWHTLAAICASQTRGASQRSSHSAIRSGRSTTVSLSVNASRVQISPLDSAKEVTLGGAQTIPTGNVSSDTVVSSNPLRPSGAQASTQHIEGLVRRCISHMVHAVLSEGLVEYITTMKEHMPSLSAELQAALDDLVDQKLMNGGQDDDSSGAMKPNSVAPSHSNSTKAFGGAINTTNKNTSSKNTESNGSVATTTFGGANSAVGRFAQYLGGGSGGNNADMGAANGGVNTQRSGTSNALASSFHNGNPTVNNNNNTGNGNDNNNNVFGGGNIGSSMGPFNASFASASSHGGSAGVTMGVNGFASDYKAPSQSAPFAQQQQQQQQLVLHPVEASELALALEVFAKRQISSVQQLEKVKNSIIPFQRHTDVMVRQQCCTSIIQALSLWTSYAKQHRTSTYSTRVTEILEVYLKHVMIELNPKVRLMEIQLLADASDLRPFLMDQRILKTLMSFLHDTANVREKTVELLVALTQDPRSSPSVDAVQQSLLVMVESCVVALEYSADLRILIRHMSDLQTIAKFSLKPLMGHLRRIFNAFCRQLSEETLADVIALSIIKTLHAFFSAFEKDEEVMLQYQDDMVELYMPVVSILFWSTSHALSHAVIGVLVQMHVMGASPREWNATELHEVLHFISAVYMGGASTSTEEQVDQVLTLFGQLGAVDPSTKPDTATVKKKKDDEAAIQDEADLELTYDYTIIVYRDLSRMLDVSLSEVVCMQAMRTLLHLVQSTTEKREVIEGTHAVKAVLQIAKRASDTPSLRVEALHILAALTALRHERISKTLFPEIVVLLEQLWYIHDHALFRALLEVVSALKPGNLSTKEQLEVWPWLYPRLVDVALQDRTESRELCLRVLSILHHASFIPPHCIPIVFPMLMQHVQQSDQLVEVRSLSLCVAIHIVCDLKAVQHVSSLLHAIRTLTRHCELSEDLGPRFSTLMVRNSLKILAALYPSGKVTIRALRNCLRDTDEEKTAGSSSSPVGGNDTAAPDSAMASAASIYMRRYQPTRIASSGHQSNNSGSQQRPVLMPLGSRSGSNLGHYLDHHVDDDDDDANSRLMHKTYAQGEQDITLFMRHVEYGLRTKDIAWREWFTEFKKYIIVVSPHPAFRMVVDLFDKHEPFRRKLFFPSFKCFYESLNAEHMKKVNEVLNLALRSSDSEVVCMCLSLSDYLDHNPPNIKEPILNKLRKLGSNETFSQTALNHPLDSYDAYQQLQRRQGGEVISDNFHFETPTVSFGSQYGNMNSFGNTSKANPPVPEATMPQPKNNPRVHSEGDNTGSRAEDSNRDQHDPAAPGSSATLKDFGDAMGVGFHPDEEIGGEFGPLARPICASGRTQNTPNLPLGAPGTETLAVAGTEGVVALQRASPIPNSINPLFSVDSLVEAAQRSRMYDKAMSFLEAKLSTVLELYRHSRIPKETVHSVVFPLAWLYSKREMQDSVVGLFRAIRFKSESEDGFGYELLQWWDVAQSVYAKKVQDHKSSTVELEGYVRTLCLCGEWEKALEFVKNVIPRLQQPSSTIAESGAMAAWILGEWEEVRQLTERIPVVNEKSNTALKLFFLNAANLHDFFQYRGVDVLATDKTSGVGVTSLSWVSTPEYLRENIHLAKMGVDESLKTLLPLSYAHAYENITMLQHFTEMEEQIVFVESQSNVFREQLIERWRRRFVALKPDSLAPSLQSLLLHSLVLDTSVMSDMILNFCERMGPNYPQLASWAMTWLQNGSFPRSGRKYQRERTRPNAVTSLYAQPSVAVVYISQIWSEGRRKEAIQMMEKLLDETRPTLEERHPQCYGSAQLRLSAWKQETCADSFWKSTHRMELLRHYHAAIRAVPSSHEAWHSWGLMNYRIQQRDHGLTEDCQHEFVEAAHQGFVAAICRSASPSTALPSLMRLLQLWVIHNGVSLLKESVADSVARIPTDLWVQAIPQIIGHLSSRSHDVREVISMILRKLSEVHSQAVVFPLLVVFMSDESQPRRRELAHSIITHLPKRIRTDAELVAKLLIDVSAIPIEKIRENLSVVSTAWNPQAEYEEDPEEVRRRLRAVLEIFNANRRHLLYTVGDIGQYVQMVMDDEKRGDREKASTIVGQLLEEITKHIAEKLGKEPQKAMEPLVNLRNLSIAVFGEYDIQYTNFPTITSFSSKLDVIPSKKRPRRIRLNGSNGFVYTYCLKGNEDIRMDERVMQLFGMVNVLLNDAHMPNSAFIHRFPVIPISNNVGLLGWVEHANTINNTICIYRNTTSKLCTNQESSALRLYVDAMGSWDKLSMIQRTEALDFVMSQPKCEAVDVARAMWHRSDTAEQWLERRTTYTQSLATMSMVGYVLGLGDRHLGNILLSMSTGKIVHIDFGDSFDVGRLRQVLPETVPFRLTRMLTNAMEVFGVDGNFRSSCTRTQATLHRDRDSIMALLSAFLHDPIVQHKGKMKNVMEKSRSPQDIAERIRNKLRGAEMAVENSRVTIYHTVMESTRRPDLLYMSKAFDDVARRKLSHAYSPHKQISMLIDEATRVENYAALYFGWGPLW